MHHAPFRFRLERIRALREREQDLARERLAASLGTVRDGEGAVAGADAQVQAAGAAQRAASGLGVTGADLVHLQAFRERTERQRREALEELERRRVEASVAQADLASRTLEREALERLKERRRSEHAKHAERIAGALLDDLAGRMRPQAGTA